MSYREYETHPYHFELSILFFNRKTILEPISRPEGEKK